MAKNRSFERWAQERLNAHGARLEVDGRVGPKTRRAIENFQRLHGLKVTGMVDSATEAKLRGDPVKPAKLKGSVSSPSSKPPSTSGQLVLRAPPKPERLKGTVSSPRSPPPSVTGRLERSPDRSGPGGSPGPVPPPKTLFNEILEGLGIADVVVPNYTERRAQPMVDPTTGNSPLAGVEEYTPPDGPGTAAAAEAPAPIYRQQPRPPPRKRTLRDWRPSAPGRGMTPQELIEMYSDRPMNLEEFDERFRVGE